MTKTSVSQLVGRANYHTKKREFSEAEKLYAEVLMSFPNNKKALQGLNDLRRVSRTSFSGEPPQQVINQLISIVNEEKLVPAVKLVKNLLIYYPKAIALWNILGISSAQAGQFDQAIIAFEKIITLKPNQASAYYNLGNVFKDMGQMQQAVDSYTKALELEPQYEEAFNNLTVALATQDQVVGKRQLSVIELYQELRLLNAKNAGQKFESGILLQREGKLDEAINAYRKSIEQFPDFFDAYNNIGIILREQGEQEEAIEAFSRAVAIKPDFAEAYNNMGIAFKEQGELEKEIEAFSRAVAIKPNFAEAHNNMGIAFKEQGELEEAIEAFKKALNIKPDFAEAHRNLSSVIKYNSEMAQIRTVKALLERTDLSDSDRCNLLYTNAKMQEELGDLRSAFNNYVAGGDLRKKILGYDFTQDKSIYARIKQTAQELKEIKLDPSEKIIMHTPIFILGMPRSGTTLVEQIISSHSDVFGAGELPYVLRFGTNLVTGITAPTLKAVSAFREQYLTMLAKKADRQALITDKMPQNFAYIALICAALPEAKIVHVKRNSKATCWSNFKHYFASKGLGYSYNLSDTVKYYGLYKDLMQFWYQSYDDRIYNLDYDKLTENQELETRRLIEYLGLEWEDACLAPQKNKRSVGTASNQQVRRKVYTGSSEAWRKYEPFLDGIFDELEV